MAEDVTTVSAATHNPTVVSLRPPPTGLIAALASVMSEVEAVPKRGTNAFHKYKYVTMGDLLQHVTPLLGRHGIVIWQTEVSRALFDDGNVLAIEYSFTVAHVSGETWEPIKRTGMSRCRDSKGGYDDKAMNKASTAARKYFLLSLLQIPTEETDDADRGDLDGTWPARSSRAPTVVDSPRRVLERQLKKSTAQTERRNFREAEWRERALEEEIRASRPIKPRWVDPVELTREPDPEYAGVLGPEPPPHDDDDIPKFLDRRPATRRS